MLGCTFVYEKMDPAVQQLRCRIEAREAVQGARAQELHVSVNLGADSQVRQGPWV